MFAAGGGLFVGADLFGALLPGAQDVLVEQVGGAHVSDGVEHDRADVGVGFFEIGQELGHGVALEAPPGSRRGCRG